MRISPAHALLLLAPFAHANEALDVLEGKIDANSVVLPPPPYKEGAEGEAGEEEVGELIYLEPEWAPSPLDSIWSRSVLYDSTANPWVQQVAITGYFDFQGSFGQAETDASGLTPARNTDLDGTRTRRARLGARIRAFNNTEIEAIGEFAGSDEYSGIERLKAYTQLSDTTGITYGKFRPNFGTESRTEQQLSPYFNRTATTDMFAPASSLGVSIHHAGKDFDYDVGWFSGDYSADLPSVEGDGFLNLSISRTTVEKNGDSLARVRWHADYIHNFDPGNTNPAGYNLAGQLSANGAQFVQNPAYRHLFSTGFAIDSDRYAVTADFQLAKGNTTAWGLSLGGSYWVMPGTLKLVGRYQYAGTDDARAIVTTFGNSGGLRYDDSPFFTGDEYHSFYLGANLHLYKDGLILRNGLEYSILNDDVGNSFNTEAFTWRTGASISF
ncbi:MAG: hypothetical protein NWT08_06820 [Akkermansiaceae bacterium]|jgi:hypothetical protein|nr:hypothetical protein [Akkermansiaceae bacterium]MDP4647377.1 hypothetical protein [Akkermansiaceae bacterium]MDP4779529.1 hypothetical protein [Akkermansiaceae bacterium]MDP4847347.1 hypothetical protein [Akkermansiaceae bacterium]MDP4898918.1 hypothetical protein [Akkermansiaceae bacterium]